MTIISLDANTFVDQSQSLPVIDVRSPGEFSVGHIPGAISIPLFDDDQRAEIGTLYKNGNRQIALLKGLEFAGAKLADIVQQSISISKDDSCLIYCWRGGMRSRSFAWAVEQAEMQAAVLTGGYKAYRRLAHDFFNNRSRL